MNSAVRTARNAEAWIRRFHHAPDDGLRLVCLPHAGGSASFYHPLSAALSPYVGTYAVQYPGRQDRRHEPCVDSIPELADAIFEVLKPWTDQPLALFGHSMGATLAFEVAVRVEERLGTSPTALFLSGRRAPSHFRPESVHTLDDAGIIAELATLSGTDPRVLREPEILDMVLPMLRSDYRAIETYRGRPGDRVSCPMTVLTGDTDERVSAEEAAAWADHACGGFSLRTFRGGHFYLNDHLREVAAVITDSLVATRAA
ncbi:thioesterase II family protein [Streptomyces sp. GESEQ-35]|uniref:thioesterase II family protein n=1 Tax=Streptomyces sp. GESEQ-35 TaxID=2812657 RepID=UPI001B34127B|nr:alpha/beta fold hydrolase [Streptomyces sp. GESEQ-35]